MHALGNRSREDKACLERHKNRPRTPPRMEYGSLVRKESWIHLPNTGSLVRIFSETDYSLIVQPAMLTVWREDLGDRNGRRTFSDQVKRMNETMTTRFVAVASDLVHYKAFEEMIRSREFLEDYLAAALIVEESGTTIREAHAALLTISGAIAEEYSFVSRLLADFDWPELGSIAPRAAAGMRRIRELSDKLADSHAQLRDAHSRIYERIFPGELPPVMDSVYRMSVQ
jgi:hypothetical protein